MQFCLRHSQIPRHGKEQRVPVLVVLMITINTNGVYNKNPSLKRLVIFVL